MSRAIGRLESDLGVRLFQRSTRTVQLTSVGEALRQRCAASLASIDEAIEFAVGLGGKPRGLLRISAGIGFGITVLGRQLPAFLERYPEVDVPLDLTSREADLVAEGVDIAIRMGPLSDSDLVVSRLGRMTRHLCAAPVYLARRGRPLRLAELAEHDTIEMPGRDGRPRTWVFTNGDETERIDVTPRVSVNDALTIVQLVHEGASVGIISRHLCAPAFAAGTMIALFPERHPPAVEVSLVFPSRRELSPTVRAFVDFMREMSTADVFWRSEPADTATRAS